MSKDVDLSVPLSDEDREYLQQRSRNYDIEENDRVFKRGKFAEKDDDEVEPVFAPTPTVAPNPIEPGSAADRPPQFVGQRPYGVDRQVWAGSTGQERPSDEQLTLDGIPSSAQNPDPFVDQAALANPESTTAANDAENPQTGDGDDGDDEDDDDEPDVNIEDLNVEELQAELAQRGLKVSGNKPELQERLKEAIEKEANG